MRIPALGLALVATAMLLSGCVPGDAAPSASPTRTASPTPEASSTPTATPTAEPAPGTEPVDPSAYATQIADLFGVGVDFDSVDGNIHCGIWESRQSSSLAGVVMGPYAGCRPNELLTTYETDPSSTGDGNVGCNGGQLTAGTGAEPVCNNGQAFVGEAPENGPVGTLPVGASISYAGFVCVGIDPSTIECVRSDDGAGFTVGLTSYRYF